MHPRDMLALMGPSGAGKSTLMDILAGRKSVGLLSGQVLVNGQPRGREFVRKTAYVPQVGSAGWQRGCMHKVGVWYPVARGLAKHHYSRTPHAPTVPPPSPTHKGTALPPHSINTLQINPGGQLPAHHDCGRNHAILLTPAAAPKVERRRAP